MTVLWQCLSPCGVRPRAIGSQHASAQPDAYRLRAGTPGQGLAITGTGRDSCGAFFGYQPVVADWNNRVANPVRRQCAAVSAGWPART